MPLYAYKCTNCQTIFEIRRTMSDSHAEEQCIECNAKAAWIPSLFASKEGYNLRLPVGTPYR